MLVQFKSDVGGFTMFGEVAQKLLRMCGHSGTVPGAIPAEDLAAARDRLREALEHVEATGDDAVQVRDDDESAEPPVPLRRRAFPLLDLLDRAVTEGCGVHWDEP
jgi:hypothetical protein